MGMSKIQVLEQLKRSKKILKEVREDSGNRLLEVADKIARLEKEIEAEKVKPAPGAKILRVLNEVRDAPTKEALVELCALLDLVVKGDALRKAADLRSGDVPIAEAIKASHCATCSQVGPRCERCRYVEYKAANVSEYLLKALTQARQINAAVGEYELAMEILGGNTAALKRDFSDVLQKAYVVISKFRSYSSVPSEIMPYLEAFDEAVIGANK